MTQIVVLAAVMFAFASWLFIIVEFIGMAAFWPWAFELGPVILRESRVIHRSTAADASFETDEWVARAQGSLLSRLRRKFVQPGWYLYTGFPVKMTVRWSGDTAEVVGRLPLGPLLFLLAWTVGWTAAWASSLGEGGSIVVLAVGWVFAIGASAYAIPLERRRAKQVLDEYAQRASSRA